MVSHCDYPDTVSSDLKDHLEWKSLHQSATGSVLIFREAIRGFEDRVKCDL